MQNVIAVQSQPNYQGISNKNIDMVLLDLFGPKVKLLFRFDVVLMTLEHTKAGQVHNYNPSGDHHKHGELPNRDDDV